MLAKVTGREKTIYLFGPACGKSSLIKRFKTGEVAELDYKPYVNNDYDDEDVEHKEPDRPFTEKTGIEMTTHLWYEKNSDNQGQLSLHLREFGAFYLE